jgi:hypothetical protein
MISRDPRVSALLDRLVPDRLVEAGDWDELVREAAQPEAPHRLGGSSQRYRFNRRRQILALATAIGAAILVAVPALGINGGWWFLGGGEPQPTTGVSVIATGTSAAIDWTLTAFISRNKGACVALTPSVRGRSMGGQICGTNVRGEPNTSRPGTGATRHWIGIGYFALGLYNFPAFLYGPVAQGVDHVDVVLANGARLEARTLDPPDDFGARIDFYVVEVPRHLSVQSVIARDQSGTTLEELPCSGCSPVPSQQ